MNPERWKKVDRVLQSVLEQPADRRAAYLEEACAGDAVLRGEVESLIASYERSEDDSLISSRAMRVAAPLLEAGRARLEEGREVGHYVVLRQLGAGGMGEVYLAHDARLERNVALKVLPAGLASDRQRMQRFEQEAKAVSALNHPNILTIYEVGEADGANFIATEFIDGETLRRHLSGRRVKLHEVLDLAIQIAAALDAAHEAGVVHRDVKPENVMVRRRDGYVKVLDFGLAKLAERATDPEAATRPFVRTEPGLVLGTVAYMSPEQTRGRATDARTDIWSLGVVLYEMVAGRLPFEGADIHRQVIAIQDEEPPPLSTRAEGVPEELQRIVSKALAKEAGERYQTVKDLLIDLRNLKRRLELDAEIERSVSPSRVGASAGGARAGTAEGAAARTALVEGAHTVSSAAYVAGVIKRHKRGTAVALGVLALAAAGIAVGLKYFGYLRAKSSEPFGKIKMTRLTTTGKANFPGISPDGKYLVYVTGERAQESVRLMHIPTGSDKEIVPPAGVLLCCSFFSADGNYIYYAKTGTNVPSIVYKMPVLGGATQVIGEDLDTPPTFSPDGKRMAFLRGYPTEGVTALMIANADGTGEQRLMTYITTWVTYIGGPAWSPDGEVILMGIRGVDANGLYRQMVTVRVKDGTVTQINSQRWSSLGQFAWLRDGSGFIFTGSDQPSEFPMQIWYASYPGGETRRITNDVYDYRWVRMTADSQAFVTTSFERLSSLWVAPGADAARAARITANKYDGLDGVAFAPDGRVVYTSSSSSAGGNPNIWIANADGTGQKQLTADASSNIRPTVSPDGRYVVFVSDRAGAQNIWRIDIDGRNPTRLTNGQRDLSPHCSPDGRWVFYTSTTSGKQRVTRVPIEGGGSVPLTDYTSSDPAVSPDGKQIACGYFDEKLTRWKVVIIPAEGGPPVRTFDVNVWPMKLRWAPDGRALNYIQRRAGVSNLWSQPTDGGKPTQLTDFKSDEIGYFDWSRDGRLLVLSRNNVNNDVVLVSDLK